MPNRPLLITTEQRSPLPILIIDKSGYVGKGLARHLRSSYLVVLITGDTVEEHENVIHIPYRKRVPLIPDNHYSHIYVVYNGETEILDLLPSFLKKAEQSQSRIILSTSIFLCTEKLMQKIRKIATPRLQMVLVGELFAQRNAQPNTINYLIQQAQLHGRITLTQSGLRQLHPILYDDAIEAIISVGFQSSSIAQLFYAFHNYPYTEIAIARMLQKHNPLVKIDYTKKKHKESAFFIPPGGIPLFTVYDLEAKIPRLEVSALSNSASLTRPPVPVKPRDPDVQKRRILLFCTLLFSLFIAPILVTVLLVLSGGGFLSLSLKQAQVGDFVDANRTATVAGYAFSGASALIPSLVLPAIIVPDLTDQFSQRMQTAEELVQTERDGLLSLTILQRVYNDESKDPKNDFLHALAILKNTLLTVQKMKAENTLPDFASEKVTSYASLLQRIEGTIDTWPQLFGFESAKTYMICFQNNMELRPGGGFIGSYALVSLKNGKVKQFRIADVYDADGKLKTSIEPPYGLARYLGARHWFLRDSNFDIDSLKNATMARDFLQKETGEHIDGVITIDTTFLKDLLSVVGSVHVPEYNVDVTADNFYIETETHVEKNFFPGSTQKRDFLRSLSNALVAKLTSGKGVSAEKLLHIVDTSLSQKHLLVGVFDAGVQNVLSVNGFSSSPKETKLRDPNTVLDFFGVVDANVGANKSNYYLKRSVTQLRRFDSVGGLQATAEVTYKNESDNSRPFGGDYKNYVRFLLPEDVSVQSIYIDNQEQQIVPAVTDFAAFTEKGFVPPQGLEVEETDVQGRKVVGFFVLVPMGQTRKVTVTYLLPKAVDLSKQTVSYSLSLFKQPGTLADDYQITFLYPQNYSLITSEKEAVNVGGKLNYETSLTEDKQFSVILSHK